MSFRRQHGQLRPSSTDAEVLFNPITNLPYTMDSILAANRSGASVIISVYHDADGTTYDDDTIIFGPYAMVSGETMEVAPEKGISDYQSAGNIAVKISVIGAVNFTLWGEIFGEVL